MVSRRGIVKVEAGDEDWESGALLEKGERFETDAEWHASLLEEIQFKLEELQGSLEDVSDVKDDIAYIRGHYERLAHAPISNNHQPMPTWRFVFSWLMAALIIFGMVNLLSY